MPGEPRYAYGMYAWKKWWIQKSDLVTKRYRTLENLNPFKIDILQLTPEQLEFALILFIKDVRRPTGEKYSSETIFYILMGIQQFLMENGMRIDIFADNNFMTFSDHLYGVLSEEDIPLRPESFGYRVDEEFLWETKHLGTSTPHSLIMTLLYFNTKYFKLKKVEDHLNLRFHHVAKCIGLCSNGNLETYLLYNPPVTNDNSNENSNLVQTQLLSNPSRCPVNLYEFYISKCPRNILKKKGKFYLAAFPNSLPSGQWFMSSPLRRKALDKLLQRVELVEDITNG